MYELYLKVQNELAFFKYSGVGFCRKERRLFLVVKNSLS